MGIVVWYCEKCQHSGAIRMDDHAGVCEGVFALTDHHRSRAPECRGGIETVRVFNEADEDIAALLAEQKGAVA